MTVFGKPLTIQVTNIPGLLIIDLPVHGDSRGWFKENWQREKMQALGLPDFGPVQNNISFNDEVGTTRGIHAEPWDKYVSVATGKIFGAWVDLREGETFGQVFTHELDASQAIFVPRGVGNSYQTLQKDTAYVYLVNEHWNATAEYTFLNLADEATNINWPIPLERASLSEKDKSHPRLSEVLPMKPKKALIIGANGQLGRALRTEFPHADFASRAEIDLSKAENLSSVPWADYSVVINAAAYTAVDQAETPDGRQDAWKVNVRGVSELARHCAERSITLVHVSSDYVFDGTKQGEYTEEDPVSPLGVYGQTKAAGDAAVALVPRHYILRTSWVIGDGDNFVSTMMSLAIRGVKPSVVNDQYGRLCFSEDLADAISFLVSSSAPFGTYNMTNSGEIVSWAEIAQKIYFVSGRNPAFVRGVTSEEYFHDKALYAKRPLNSALDLTKLKLLGYEPPDWVTRLSSYVQQKLK